MRPVGDGDPRHTLLYRIIALLTRGQLLYRLRGAGNERMLLLVFVCLAGATALAIITLAAYLTELPLLFPPLGPSAFILFYMPMSEQASPRNVILSHTTSLMAGMGALMLTVRFFPDDGLTDPEVLNGPRVLAIALAVGLAAMTMILLKSVHAPAAATAVLAAMGFFETPLQMLGLVAAVVLLAMEAFLLNRIVGGLPYPVWRSDPTTSRKFGVLAGIPTSGQSHWQQLSSQIFRHRDE